MKRGIGMLIAGGLAAIVTTTLSASSLTLPNLEQMIANTETQTIYYNNQTLDLIKTEPESIELWYKGYTEVDNKTYGNGYLCLSFAMESSLEWIQFSGYNGLYLVISSAYPDHAFNAVFVGGDYKDINNWVFFEPQNGRRVNVGISSYHLPIAIDLIWEVVMRGGDDPSLYRSPIGVDLSVKVVMIDGNDISLYQFPTEADLILEAIMRDGKYILGNNPRLKLVWNKQNEEGILYMLDTNKWHKVDEGNYTDLKLDTPK